MSRKRRRGSWRATAVAFMKWLYEIIRNLCDRPDHLQRLSIIGAGVAMYPLLIGLVWLTVWMAFKFATTPGVVILVVQSITWLMFGVLGAVALVVVALLGIIRKVKASAPGGASLEIDLNERGGRNDDRDHGRDSFNEDECEDEGPRFDMDRYDDHRRR